MDMQGEMWMTAKVLPVWDYFGGVDQLFIYFSEVSKKNPRPNESIYNFFLLHPPRNTSITAATRSRSCGCGSTLHPLFVAVLLLYLYCCTSNQRPVVLKQSCAMVKSKKAKKKAAASSGAPATTTASTASSGTASSTAASSCTTTAAAATSSNAPAGGSIPISGSFTLKRDEAGNLTSVVNNATGATTSTAGAAAGAGGPGGALAAGIVASATAAAAACATSSSNNNAANTTSSGTTNSSNSNKKSSSSSGGGGGGAKGENLDDLQWLRECELRHTATGEPYLQLEYQDDDELIILLQRFLEESKATKEIIDAIYQIWQQTVLSTLLQSSAVWKKESVTASDQRNMKDMLKQARYKINFILHHLTGSMLTSTDKKWTVLKPHILDMCYNTLLLVPRLAESCPHSPTDIRLAIIHFEGKEFLAAVACETWDTLYDFAIPIDATKFIPVLRRCAMLDILDKDWNMLGGWEDILKGMEAKCCKAGSPTVQRLPSDAVLHEKTTILRNARNSMQCKFFSVRFMRYTEDQAPQRWRYFPKCSAPACANIETAADPHPHRCHKCWYFHYCSAACQEYCDNIMGLHPKFCKDTPASKSALCQKETEQYLGWTTAAAVPDESVPSCHVCGALEEDGTVMRRCQQCESVSYCGRQCQEWDWKVGGHREVCGQQHRQQQHDSSTTTNNNSATNGGSGVETIKELN